MITYYLKGECDSDFQCTLIMERGWFWNRTYKYVLLDMTILFTKATCRLWNLWTNSLLLSVNQN